MRVELRGIVVALPRLQALHDDGRVVAGSGNGRLGERGRREVGVAAKAAVP
jgi:hypothetical protein